MAKGDITSVTVDADGWFVSVRVEALTTDVDGVGDYSLDIDGTPKVVLNLTRPGYTTAGGATTVADTVIGTKPVRKVYPNNADLDVVDNLDGTVTVKLSLSEYIYASDTSVTADFTAGWFTGAGAATGEAVTNSSTQAYPRPVAQWNTVGLQRVTGDFAVECSAYHRFGVQLVEFDCADQSTNNAATQSVTEETWSTLATKGKGHGCYTATIPVSALDQGEVLDCNFKVYPKIGDTTLDTRTTQQGTAQPSSLLGPLHMLNDKSGTYGVTFAAVDGVGGGTPAVSTTEAGALTNPYADITAAVNGIKAYNNTNYSRNDAGAGVVVITNGTTVDFATSGTGAIVTANNDTWCTIRPETSGSATVGTASLGNQVNTGSIKVEGVTCTGGGTGIFRGSNAAGTSAIWFDNCTISLSGTAGSYQWGATYLTDCAITQWKDMAGFSTGRSVWKVIQGNDFNATATAGGFALPIQPISMVGNDGDWRIADDSAFGDDGFNYRVVAYNKNRGNQSANTLVISRFADADADSLAITTGFAFVNNLIDPQTTSTPAAVLMGGDGTNVGSENVIMWGNTVEGQRTNFAYNDANNPTHKQWSVKYNHFHDFNIKSDVFSTNGANDNNWSCLFGAGLQGNNDENVTATDFEVEVALDHTTLAPGFTDQAGDDYTPGTNLNRGSGTHPLKYDIEGNLRNGDLYSGAVTISAAVVASGGVGTLNVDKMTALKDITGQSAGTVNDLEMYFLRTTLSLSGTNNDGWYAHMGTLGYSGAINDRWGQWFVASGVSDYDEFWYEAAQGNINLNP